MILDPDDLFPEQTAPSAPSPRDLCISSVESLPVDSVVAVGGKAWQVWRSQGVTKYLTKAGTKAKKLYRLHLTGNEPCCVEVKEVNPGSGEFKAGPAAAKGCFVSTGVFMGAAPVRKPRPPKL